MVKELKSRFVHKHDTEAHWNLAVNFIPLAGELVLYDPDENNSAPRLKEGDGINTVANLPFMTFGGSGGVSSYDDLTDTPMYLSQPEYTQADSIGTGIFLGNVFTKISDSTYTLSELIGGSVAAGGTDYEMNSARVQDLSSMVSGYGYPGSYVAAVSMSGNVSNFDYLVIILDSDWTSAAMGIQMTAGTYIASAVTTLSFPQSVVINPDYEANLLPAVTADDTGKVMKAVGGKMRLSAKTSVTGCNDIKNLRIQLFQGIANYTAPLYSQISLFHDEFGEIPNDVVHHNSTDKTMTLLMHDMQMGFEFDAPEGLAYFPSGLPAGTYYFDATNESNVNSGDQIVFSFTLTEDIPVNGILCLSLDVMNWHIGTTVSTYAADDRVNPIETVALSEGQSGTDLTTAVAASCFNYYAKAIYGNANYGQSGIFKYFNATGDDWWTPSSPWDMPPSYVNRKGFLSGFDSETLAALEDVTVTMATNHVHEYGVSTDSTYTVTGKFHLPSITELSGYANGYSSDVYEGTQWSAFSDYQTVYEDRAEYAPLIKRTAGMDWYWWERSPDAWHPTYVRSVRTDGHAACHNLNAANPTYGAVAACIIKPIYAAS